MKTQASKHLIAVFVLAIGAANAADVNTENESGLIYNNRAYTHGIQSYPNPEPDRFVWDAEIIYVNAGYGQAVYSYPRNVADQRVAMNVEYVSQAYGPAIYSYPNNNPQVPSGYLRLSELNIQ